jgi:hypothetical protein
VSAFEETWKGSSLQNCFRNTTEEVGHIYRFAFLFACHPGEGVDSFAGFEPFNGQFVPIGEHDGGSSK